MKLIKENNPYLMDEFFIEGKRARLPEPLHRRIIRALYTHFLDELYIPYQSEIAMTYGAKGKRGIKISYSKLGAWRGTQERYFDMPKDIYDIKTLQ